MKRSIRTAVAAVAGVAAAGLTLLTAPTAAQAATTSCTDTPFGQLCANVDPSGYRASLQPRADASGYAKVNFRLVCGNGWYGDQGAFYVWPNNNYSYVFYVGRQGQCRVELVWQSANKKYSTGNVSA